MKTKSHIIVGLLITGVILFGIVQFVIVPRNDTMRQQYLAAQLEPTTHDLHRILEYKTPYIGNNSNTINLFCHLPLANYGTTFQIFPDDYGLEVNYHDTIYHIGEEKVHKSLIYNSTAAFALIGNLDQITYNFSDESYIISCAGIQSFLGQDLSTLLSIEKWKTMLQDQLDDPAFVSRFMKDIIKHE